MALLTATQLSELRQKFTVGESPTWTKATVNAALQAIEDWYEANKATGVTAVNTATSPTVFTANQKKKLFAFWLYQKFIREGV